MDSEGPARAALRRSVLVAAIAVGLAATAHVYIHVSAGLNFPVPWPDELHFALPAQALADNGSLAAAQLHPHRPLMWMPPGYAFISAPIHLVFAQPLSALRGLSLAATLCSALLLWRLIAGAVPCRRSVLVGSLAASMWLLHPSVLAAGNTARMDMCVLVLVLGGFVALQLERPWWAIVSLGLAPLVHPNGMYFVAAACVWRVVVGRRVDLPAPLRPTAVQSTAMALVAVAWLAYTVHVALNWGAFIDDMGWQLQRKAGRDLLASVASRHGLRLGALTLLALARPDHDRAALPWVFALAAWLLARVGHEMWYEPFDALVLVLLLATAVDVLAQAPHAASPRRRGLAIAFGVTASAMLLVGVHKDLPASPSGLTWKHMSLHDESYVGEGTPTERERVAQALRAASPGPVEFTPRGDALLFFDQPGISFVDPVRFAFGEVPTVLHLSPAHPRHWRARARAKLDAARDEGRAVQLLYSRDDRHQWWLLGAELRH